MQSSIESACNAGEAGLIPESGRAPGGERSNLLHGVVGVRHNLVTTPAHHPIKKISRHAKNQEHATRLPNNGQ